MCFVPQRRAIFWSFGPSGATNCWKIQWFATSLPFVHSDLLHSLLWLFPPLLLHLSILSEVWFQNFLRQSHTINHIQSHTRNHIQTHANKYKYKRQCTYKCKYIIHGCMQYRLTQIATHIPTNLHTYMRTYIRTCIPECLLSYIHTYIYKYLSTYVCVRIDS